VDAFLESTGNRGGRVGNSPSYLIAAGELYDFAVPLMQAAAS
jgi:hypothetical protein